MGSLARRQLTTDSSSPCRSATACFPISELTVSRTNQTSSFSRLSLSFIRVFARVRLQTSQLFSPGATPIRLNSRRLEFYVEIARHVFALSLSSSFLRFVALVLVREKARARLMDSECEAVNVRIDEMTVNATCQRRMIRHAAGIDPAAPPRRWPRRNRTPFHTCFQFRRILHERRPAKLHFTRTDDDGTTYIHIFTGQSRYLPRRIRGSFTSRRSGCINEIRAKEPRARNRIRFLPREQNRTSALAIKI